MILKNENSPAGFRCRPLGVGDMNGGRVLAIAGAKGGIGKTTTSINLAAALTDRGRSVIVVECDLGMANLVDFLSLPYRASVDADLHAVLAGNAAPRDAIYPAPDGFDVLPSGVCLEGYVAADPTRLEQVIPQLRSGYDVVVLDLGAGLSYESVIPMNIADEVLLVSSPRVASVRDTRKTKELAEVAECTVTGIVFVKSGTGKAPPPERIADFLDVDLLGHVPEDDHVPASQDAGRPVVAEAPNSPAAAAYDDVAKRLARPVAPA